MTVKPCNGCTIEDDHPRHVLGTVGATGGGIWHLDCHASSGCTSCVERLRDAEYRKGLDLTAYFASLRQHVAVDDDV